VESVHVVDAVVGEDGVGEAEAREGSVPGAGDAGQGGEIGGVEGLKGLISNVGRGSDRQEYLWEGWMENVELTVAILTMTKARANRPNTNGSGAPVEESKMDL
jgi:hypothetical protein